MSIMASLYPRAHSSSLYWNNDHSHLWWAFDFFPFWFHVLHVRCFICFKLHGEGLFYFPSMIYFPYLKCTVFQRREATELDRLIMTSTAFSIRIKWRTVLSRLLILHYYGNVRLGLSLLHHVLYLFWMHEIQCSAIVPCALVYIERLLSTNGQRPCALSVWKMLTACIFLVLFHLVLFFFYASLFSSSSRVLSYQFTAFSALFRTFVFE